MSASTQTNSNTIPSLESIEKKWDRLSLSFQQHHESSTLPISLILISNLGLTSLNKPIPKAILEVGCGAGSGTELALFYKHKSTQFTACDLSNNMLALARKRLGITQIERNGNSDINNTTGESSSIGGSNSSTGDVGLDQYIDPERNFKILKANAEQLPFPDASFDRYFSNLCLHIVGDPERMMREAYRVLEEGGIACFSVWGRKSKSNQFTIIKQMGANLGFELKEQIRSQFHLSSLDLLRDLGYAAGFRRVVAGYTYSNAIIDDGREYVESYFGASDSNLKKFEKWKKSVEDYVDAQLEKGKFVGLEAGYIVCTK
eukprot:gene623-773_t